MTDPRRPAGRITPFLQRIVDVRPEEVRAMLLACAYFFCVLSSYYIIRPLREEMGVAGGVRNIPWLFTGTLVAMLAVHPPFAALVARLPRRRFISYANRFFIANLGVFFVVLHMLGPAQTVWAGRVFFVWTAVFNLFVVSVFWSTMTDVFTSAQGKRLFGFIGFGGTLGGIVGSLVTASLAEVIGPVNLLLVSMVLLELSTQAVLALGRLMGAAADRRSGDHDAVIGGGTLAGVSHVLASPYLLGICAYMILFTIGSTTLYLQQAEIADKSFTDAGARTAFFAQIDLAVNILTLATQVFLTGRIVKLLGVAVTLTLLPALSVIGFAALGAVPTIAVFVVFQVLRRAGEFAVARPAREVLYTVLSREDKYKAKNFIDTFVYRLGDQIGAWSTAGFAALGMTAGAEALVAAPLSLVWLGVGLWLGRQQEAMSRARGDG
ncbi:MAG: MFS transporter [Cytophagaceae bacterium]|nr:MFS transporter [Gemmatimonadaceae bacterium]